MAGAVNVPLRGDNWKLAVTQAIDEFPQDLRQSIGYRDVSAEQMQVIVAAEPVDEGESELCRIDLQYYPTLTARGWPSEHDELYKPGGSLAHQVDLPIVNVLMPSQAMEQSLFLGHATVGDLKHMIQEAVLNEMFEGGGFSMITKDHKGRYIRDDGSLIFPEWTK